jgi:excisionase family DNA binding protein
MSKTAFSIEEFCNSYSVGKTTVYEEISSGRLHAVKVGRRTQIPENSAAEWLKSQPSVATGNEPATWGLRIAAWPRFALSATRRLIIPRRAVNTLRSKNAISIVSSRTSSLLTLRAIIWQGVASGERTRDDKLSKRRWSAVEWKNFVPLPRHWGTAMSLL